MRSLDEIILHHSATPACYTSVDHIRKVHISRGYSDIGYHYVIQPNGKIEVGRALDLAGAHCIGHNLTSIGICLIGDFTKVPMTDEQKITLCDLIRCLSICFPSIKKVSQHSDYANTLCCQLTLTDLCYFNNYIYHYV